MKVVNKELKLHDKAWKEIKKLGIKYGPWSFLVMFGALEFIRRVKLHDMGVPLFVFDSEPLITNYSYGKTIMMGILYLPGLWFMIIGLEHVFLYEKWWKKLLSGSLSFLWVVMFIFSFVILFSFEAPKVNPSYISKDYEVLRVWGGVEVKIWNGIFQCSRPNGFEDACTPKNTSK